MFEGCMNVFVDLEQFGSWIVWSDDTALPPELCPHRPITGLSRRTRAIATPLLL